MMSGSLKLVVIGLMLCVCAITPSAVIADDDSADPFNGVFYRGFDKEGKFVVIPTRTGSYIGLVAGAIPAALASGSFHLFGAQPDVSMEAGRKTLKFVCYPCGFTFGAPFLTLKYLAWNAPLYIAAGFMGDDKPVKQVDNNSKTSQ
ncbi:MAG: hypothetical protein ACYC4Q_09255 [Victivallaceae bacterium]